MKIYKAIIAGDEMFSDTYKPKLVGGTLVSCTEGNITIEGFNPSAEEADEGTQTGTETGVEVVLNHHLQEYFSLGDKKFFTLYLKDYMNKVAARLQEHAPDQVDGFKSNMNKVMKHILGRFKD